MCERCDSVGARTSGRRQRASGAAGVAASEAVCAPPPIPHQHPALDGTRSIEDFGQPVSFCWHDWTRNSQWAPTHSQHTGSSDHNTLGRPPLWPHSGSALAVPRTNTNTHGEFWWSSQGMRDSHVFALQQLLRERGTCFLVSLATFVLCGVVNVWG